MSHDQLQVSRTPNSASHWPYPTLGEPLGLGGENQGCYLIKHQGIVKNRIGTDRYHAILSK
jgi:hypothetical protein